MDSELKKTVRRIDLLRGALIVTLVLYILVALIINSEYLTADRIRRARSDVAWALRSKNTDILLDGETTLDVKLFQDGCAVLSRNGIAVYSSGGNKYNAFTLRYSDPRLVTGDRWILCYDRGGNDWCLMDTFRILCSGTEAEPIISGAVSDDGYFALATEKFEYKGCVTVYNTKGTALARWNSDTYLTDVLFTSENRATVISLLSEKERISTVFSLFDFREGKILSSATAPDTIPYGVAVKDGKVEMLASSGSWLFDGTAVTAVRPYRDAVPGRFFQGSEATMINYPAADVTEVFSADGQELFTSDLPGVVSLSCYRDFYFFLCEDALWVLDGAGQVREQYPCDASAVYASPETVLLRTRSGVTHFGLTSD